MAQPLESYLWGNTLEATLEFTDEDDNLVDPDTVIFRTRAGRRVPTEITWTEASPDARIEHVSTGVFRTSFYMGINATWERSWQGILDGESHFERVKFVVIKSNTTPSAP